MAITIPQRLAGGLRTVLEAGPGRTIGGLLGATVLLGAQLAGSTNPGPAPGAARPAATAVRGAAAAGAQPPAAAAGAPTAALAESNGSLIAKLTGSHEVPPVATAASGSARVTVAGPTLFYQVSTSGLPSPTSIDISLGPIGGSGPVAFSIPAAAGVLTGELTAANLDPAAGVSFADALVTILAGGSYLNVHSAAAPAGEIRGQLEPETDHPIYTINAGTPPGGVGVVYDFFPRTVTVPTGSVIRLVVSGQQTATLLPAGMTAAQDPGGGGRPSGCGSDANPCFFDGTAIISVGPPVPGSTITLVIYVSAPPGTYVLHNRLQPGMDGVVTVASPGSPEISSADDVAAQIAAQISSGPPVLPPTSIYTGNLGWDMSYPDCKRGLPPSIPGTYGVIGVNAGKMFRYNPCLAAEFELARATGMPHLYINMNAAYGPTVGQGATGPAGTCAAKDKLCYGYNYGYKAARAAWRYAYHQLGPEDLPRSGGSTSRSATRGSRTIAPRISG